MNRLFQIFSIHLFIHKNFSWRIINIYGAEDIQKPLSEIAQRKINNYIYIFFRTTY